MGKSFYYYCYPEIRYPDLVLNPKAKETIWIGTKLNKHPKNKQYQALALDINPLELPLLSARRIQ